MNETTGTDDNIQPETGIHGILMSDLRGFTAITEQYPALSILPLLNLYFQKMTEIIDQHGGRVDKFMGDSVLAVFEFGEDEESPYRLLSCAIDMQLAMDEVNRFGQAHDLPDIFMGIGLDAGSVLICELGSASYRERTIFGDPVNVAARMANFALRGQVLVTESVLQQCRDRVEIGGDFNLLLKGKKQILKIHELQGLLYPEAKSIPPRENRRSPRVEAFLPVSYYRIEKKSVEPTPLRADIRDISYGGMSLLTDCEHTLLDELKIVVPFAVGDQSTSEIYAKVLSCKPEGENNYVISVEFSYLDELARRSIKTLVDHLI